MPVGVFRAANGSVSQIHPFIYLFDRLQGNLRHIFRLTPLLLPASAVPVQPCAWCVTQ
jgi:hypothetical protein